MIKKTRKICCITGLENESPNGSNMPCVLRCGVTLNMKFDRFGTHTQNITVIKMPFSFLNLKHNNFTQAKQPHSTPKGDFLITLPFFFFFEYFMYTIDVLVDCVVVSEVLVY